VKTRFVVSVNPSTAEQRRAFKSYLSSLGLGWWYWVAGTWLVVDTRAQLTAASLRDAVVRTFPGIYAIVLEIPEGSSVTWAGFGPKSPPRDMFTWIRNVWDG
jgi:hypothetical protein